MSERVKRTVVEYGPLGKDLGPTTGPAKVPRRPAPGGRTAIGPVGGFQAGTYLDRAGVKPAVIPRAPASLAPEEMAGLPGTYKGPTRTIGAMSEGIVPKTVVKRELPPVIELPKVVIPERPEGFWEHVGALTGFVGQGITATKEATKEALEAAGESYDVGRRKAAGVPATPAEEPPMAPAVPIGPKLPGTMSQPQEGVFQNDMETPEDQQAYGKAIFSDTAGGATKAGLDKAIAQHGQTGVAGVALPPNAGGLTIMAGPGSNTPGYESMTNEQRIQANVNGYQEQIDAVKQARAQKEAQQFMSLPEGQRGRMPDRIADTLGVERAAPMRENPLIIGEPDLQDFAEGRVGTAGYEMGRRARIARESYLDDAQRGVANLPKRQQGRALAAAYKNAPPTAQTLVAQDAKLKSERQSSLQDALIAGQPTAMEQAKFAREGMNMQREAVQSQFDNEMAIQREAREAAGQQFRREDAALERVQQAEQQFQADMKEQLALPGLGVSEFVTQKALEISRQNPGISPYQVVQLVQAQLAQSEEEHGELDLTPQRVEELVMPNVIEMLRKMS